ncbi:hypothetical protein ACIBI4_14595 [Streptomyces sp. NPDC050418]|uniref:hypothetical protein n=1 Tax=Streptomyces sp. NPDC050418 TaxID=3365612 RepID=UPI0037A9993B
MRAIDGVRDRSRRTARQARHHLARADPRRSLPALWRWACGEPGPGRPQPLTSELLRARRTVLPALALLVFALTAATYFDVHGRTDQVRDRISPALTDLAQARVQLDLAQDEAVRRFGDRDGESGGADGPRVAIGERYEKFISTSMQALNSATRTRAFDAAQAQELGVVNGLVQSYRNAISMASENRDNPALRKAGLSYGAAVLCDAATPAFECRAAKDTKAGPTAVLGRIAALEEQLAHEADEQPRAAMPVVLAVAAALAIGLFATVLWGTLRFRSRRLRLNSPALWALAAVATVVCALLLAGAVVEQVAQAAVRDDLDELTRYATSPESVAAIETEAQGIAARFDDAGPVGWAQTARIAVGCGAAAALAAGLALYGYGREYPAARPAAAPRRAAARDRGRRPVVVRLLLGVTVLAVLGVSTYACTGPERRTVTVLGPWTDGEEKPFVAALRSIERRTGVHYAYTGTRALRDTLLAQLQADAPPDVAILNSLGELSEYADAGSVLPLPKAVDGAAIGPWAPDVTAKVTGDAQVTARRYWVPVRVDLKSIVWRKQGGRPENPRWCLGLSSGATSGWPGTDWVEDLLLRTEGPAVYEAFATGELPWTSPAVRRAWEKWGELLPDDPEQAAAALTRSFEDDGGLLTSAGCDLEHQGSFIRRHYPDSYVPAPTTEFVPRLRAEHADSYEVSGDMAAVFQDGDAAWELLSELTAPRARTAWDKAADPRERPLFPGAAPGAPRPGSATQKVRTLLDEAERICFDASDAMPPTLRNAFQRAALEYVGSKNRAGDLGPLLESLEHERQFQDEDRAFRFDDLCEAPPET